MLASDPSKGERENHGVLLCVVRCVHVCCLLCSHSPLSALASPLDSVRGALWITHMLVIQFIQALCTTSGSQNKSQTSASSFTQLKWKSFKSTSRPPASLFSSSPLYSRPGPSTSLITPHSPSIPSLNSLRVTACYRF